MYMEFENWKWLSSRMIPGVTMCPRRVYNIAGTARVHILKHQT